MIINLSRDDDYYTQRNNKRWPLSTCNVTAAVMFLLAAGEKLKPSDNQPEDDLTALSETPEAYNAVKRLTPWFWDREKQAPSIPPRQIHVILDWVINRYIGRECVRFRQDLRMQDLAAEIIAGRPVILSGRFTKSGHMNTLVGLDYDGVEAAPPDVSRVRSWTVDDPYGNWRTNYKSSKGNNISFSTKELMTLLNVCEEDRKWGHVYIPKEAT